MNEYEDYEQATVADIFPVGGGAQLLDEYSDRPLIIEKKSLVPLQVGVAAYQRGDNGKLRNRVEMGEHEDYGFRVHALTLVSPTPEYSNIVLNTNPENAEQFSVRTAQTPPLVVDTASGLPYNTPEEVQLAGLA